MTRDLRRRVSNRLAIAREERVRTPWPNRQGEGVAVVSANYHTPNLVCGLVFSLTRILSEGAVSEIVIVDNTPGDARLEALHRGGIITLIPNRKHTGHGPGLNRGISHLARRGTVDTVWLLDSDTVVLRPDTLTDALRAHESAALTGELLPDHWSLVGGSVMISSALVRPRLCWHRPIPTFRDEGEPSRAFQRALTDAGLPIVSFPFHSNGYVLHLGSGTIGVVADDPKHPLHEWALIDYPEFDYTGYPGGAAIYAAFLNMVQAEVGPLTPDNIVAACSRDSRITIP